MKRSLVTEELMKQFEQRITGTILCRLCLIARIMVLSADEQTVMLLYSEVSYPASAKSQKGGGIEKIPCD